jgi:two-component system OmpR family response regulator
LIIDPSAECREVLSTLLQRRGVQTWVAAQARQALDVLDRHRPDVVVLDLDSDAADDSQLRDRCTGHEAEGANYVLLGRARTGMQSRAAGHVIPKPYHYAPLIRTIEALLGR